jgi:transposase-like protein
MATLKDIIRLAKELPEDCFAQVFELMSDVKDAAEQALKTAPVICIHCGEKAVKNGKNDGIQQYLCKGCRKSFSHRATSAISNSHASDNVWKAVIRDTVDGVSLAKTARELDITEPTVFHMRHKILNAIEQEFLARPVMLEGVCEVDETYILECEKGTPFGDFHHREPRTDGKASKQGLSNEYICLCTSRTSTGKLIAQAVNRATPSKEEIEQVFADRIEDDSLLLVDGNKSYNTLRDRCIVIKTDEQDRININRFHSFIKERNARARGFATKHLNRYAALFSKVFGNQEDAPDKIFELVRGRNDRFMSIEGLKGENLLLV